MIQTEQGKQELAQATARTQKAIESATKVINEYSQHIGEFTEGANDSLYLEKILKMTKFIQKEVELFQQVVTSIGETENLCSASKY